MADQFPPPVDDLWTQRDGSRPPPSFCQSCQIEVGVDHWWWEPGAQRWRCRVRRKKAQQKRSAPSASARAAKRLRDRAWLDRNRYSSRWYSYRAQDRRAGRIGTLARSEAVRLMADACHYCGLSEAGGLDRMDSSQGHVLDNVVACCAKCNMILTDLPYAAKVLLASGLRRIRREGLLDVWDTPQARGRTRALGS